MVLFSLDIRVFLQDQNTWADPWLRMRAQIAITRDGGSGLVIPISLSRASPTNGMIEHKQEDPADESDKDAPKVETRHPLSAKRAEYSAADHTAYNPENYIAKRALARFIDHLTGEIASDQSDYNPSNKSSTFVYRLVVSLGQGRSS
jgi:hypothetical protein